MSLVRLLIILMVCGMTAMAQANANKGQIVGTVVDAAGALVPGAKVAVRNTQTGLTREVATDGQGTYRFVALDPGTYDVVGTSAGFAPATLSGLVLNVGATVTADITLKVEATTTTVEVGETLIDLQVPTQTTQFTTAQIENLPILGRRFQDFATLSPTVQVDPQRGQLSFAGQRGINSNVMLDGSDYNQPFFGGIRGGERSNSIFTIPQSAIQEFQVVTSGYTAEYGRSTGGILNTITKSGTNDIHGEMFYQMRHKELGAKNPILNVASSETLQQFGGGLGGALKRDKLFWFAAGEQQFSKNPRRVFFPLLVGRTATPEIQEALNFFRAQEQPFNQTNDATAITGRGDYQFNAGHRLTLRYNVSNAEAVNGVSVGGALNPLSNDAVSQEGTEKDRTHTGTAQYTHLFSPTTINDARFTVTYELRPRLANAQAPNVSATPIANFGTRSFLPTTQDDTRYQFTDSLSVVKGQHTFKFGVDYSKVNVSQIFGFSQFGRFTFTTQDVNRILDLLSNPNRFDGTEVQYRRQIGNLTAAFGVQQLAFFGQDSWRVSSKLTLDFGLRWEGQFNPTPEANNTTLVQQVQNAAFPAGRLDPTRIPDSLNQIMPRFGFAWNPITSGRRMVVRGHTGIFYAATPLLVLAGPMNNFRTPPGDVELFVTAPAGQTLAGIFRQAGFDLSQGSLDALPVIPLEIVQRASVIANGGVARDPLVGANLLIADPNLRNPRSFQAGLGVESEVFSNFTAGLQLTYINTVNLLRNRDYNLPTPTIRPTDAQQRPFYNRAARPIPSLGTITARESSARSLFRGATASAQYRVRRLQFQAFYTLSDTRSDDDGERDATGFFYDDPLNFRPEYGYSRLDVRHSFASNAVVTLPWGFQWSGIYRARSGYPLNAIAGSDLNGDASGSTNDRPYVAPGVPMRRNDFRNRPFFNFDMRVMKDFGLGGERRKLQFSAEFFNLFNFDNVAYALSGSQLNGIYGPGPYPSVSDANGIRFQRLRLPNGAYNPENVQMGNPLQVQLGLRFYF